MPQQFTETLTTNITPAMKQELRARAKARGVPQSVIIREALRLFINTNGENANLDTSALVQKIEEAVEETEQAIAEAATEQRELSAIAFYMSGTQLIQSSVTRSNLDTDDQKRSPTQHMQTTLKRAAKLLPSIHQTVQTKAHRVWVEATGDAGYSEPLTDLKARQTDHNAADKDLNDHLDPAQDQADAKES